MNSDEVVQNLLGNTDSSNTRFESVPLLIQPRPSFYIAANFKYRAQAERALAHLRELLEDTMTLHAFTSHDPVHGWYQLGNWFVIVMGNVPGPGMHGCITKALTSCRGNLVELDDMQLQGLLGAWDKARGKVDEPDTPDSVDGRTTNLILTSRPPETLESITKKLLRGDRLLDRQVGKWMREEQQAATERMLEAERRFNEELLARYHDDLRQAEQDLAQAQELGLDQDIIKHKNTILWLQAAIEDHEPEILEGSSE